MILPNKIVFPLYIPSILFAVLSTANSKNYLLSTIYYLLAATLLGGLFWSLYKISDGKWIGGGDVKIGFVLGLLALTPFKSILLLFIASLLGTFVALPMLIQGKAKANTKLPFGPFLIVSTVIVVLYSTQIISLYDHFIFNGL